MLQSLLGPLQRLPRVIPSVSRLSILNPAASPAKRGPTGFSIFLQGVKEDIRKETGSKHVSVLMREASKRWKLLSEEEREMFNLDAKTVAEASVGDEEPKKIARKKKLITSSPNEVQSRIRRIRNKNNSDEQGNEVVVEGVEGEKEVTTKGEPTYVCASPFFFYVDKLMMGSDLPRTDLVKQAAVTWNELSEETRNEYKEEYAKLVAAQYQKVTGAQQSTP